MSGGDLVVGDLVKETVESIAAPPPNPPITDPGLQLSLSRLVNAKVITTEEADAELGRRKNKPVFSLRESHESNTSTAVLDSAIQLFGQVNGRQLFAVPYKEDEKNLYFSIADPAHEVAIEIAWTEFVQILGPKRWEHKKLIFGVCHKLGIIRFLRDYELFVYD